MAAQIALVIRRVGSNRVRISLYHQFILNSFIKPGIPAIPDGAEDLCTHFAGIFSRRICKNASPEKPIYQDVPDHKAGALAERTITLQRLEVHLRRLLSAKAKGHSGLPDELLELGTECRWVLDRVMNIFQTSVE
jgi:hypothetical protein